MTIFSLYIKAMKALAFRSDAYSDWWGWLSLQVIRWCIKEQERALWWKDKYFILRNRIVRR